MYVLRYKNSEISPLVENNTKKRVTLRSIFLFFFSFFLKKKRTRWIIWPTCRCQWALMTGIGCQPYPKSQSRALLAWLCERAWHDRMAACPPHLRASSRSRPIDLLFPHNQLASREPSVKVCRLLLLVVPYLSFSLQKRRRPRNGMLPIVFSPDHAPARHVGGPRPND